jgi:NADP-dependent 3-hydroxy acid dehydrogenase YdfG
MDAVMPWWVQALLTVASSMLASGLLVVLIERKGRLKKLEAEAHKLEAEAFAIEAEAREKVREVVRQAIRPFQQRIEHLTQGIGVLIAQLTRLGVKPEWTPQPWTPEDEEGV